MRRHDRERQLRQDSRAQKTRRAAKPALPAGRKHCPDRRLTGRARSYAKDGKAWRGPGPGAVREHPFLIRQGNRFQLLDCGLVELMAKGLGASAVAKNLGIRRVIVYRSLQR